MPNKKVYDNLEEVWIDNMEGWTIKQNKILKLKNLKRNLQVFLFIISTVPSQYLYDVFDAPKINILEL